MDLQMMTTEDLRGILDEYSPEQQMEMDAQLIREGAKALSDATATLSSCLTAIPKLTKTLRQVTKIELSDEAKSEIVTIGKSAGAEAAEEFKNAVRSVINESRRKTNHASMPAPAFYCLMLLFIALVGFAVAVCVTNYVTWNHHSIWKVLGIAVGASTLFSAITLFLFHRGWLS